MSKMKVRAGWIALLLATTLALAAPSTAATVVDDFSTYAAGSAADAGWDTDAVSWMATGHSLDAGGKDRAFAISRRSPRSTDQTVEATLTIHEHIGKDWNTAGVVIYDGDGNYWHLAFADSPEPARYRFVELEE